MNRLLFEKTGNAVWISHLDLMRVLQRSFRRAGLMLKHTGGFNQHAYVSLALPLPVGTESHCEILDYTLEDSIAPEELKSRLNAALPEGIRVIEVYESDEKLKYLTHLSARVELSYDGGVPEGAEKSIEELFRRPALEVEKKGKNGISELDIRPMILSLGVRKTSGEQLALDAVVCAQNPSLNPALLEAAVSRYLPEFRPDVSRVIRLEMLRNDGTAFR